MLHRNMDPEMTPYPSHEIKSPSWWLMSVEPLRAAFEFAQMKMTAKGDLPTGDGHAVMLFPGLASDRHATAPLKQFCESLGYSVYDWGRGFNTGPEGDVDTWLDALASDVDLQTRSEAGRITLIGWSLGGIYAREVAKRLSGRVRQVITLGTPFAAGPASTNAALAYRLLNGQTPPIDEALFERMRACPVVPTTSIYSRSDGIVAWQACVQHNEQHDEQRLFENVEVEGSHCGLGWNPTVYAVIADRLAQADGRWRPYEAAERTPLKPDWQSV